MSIGKDRSAEQVSTDRMFAGVREVLDNAKHNGYRGLIRRNRLELLAAEAAALRVRRLFGICAEPSAYLNRALDTLTEESGRWGAAA